MEDILNRLLKGEKIKALVNCDGKVYKRQLRLFETQYSASGYDIVCTTPRYRNYHILKENELIKIF